ncbi:MAG: Dam family site-specific DNA-(adenine-N6)-methyltransferase [Legionella sp.]|nr:MAG: Dam family site-specific DNA-(adenine-N6)-methyltransferase [Legionella sp.]
MNKTRAFLKWAGSKYNCLNEILNHLPQGTRLIEPFGGSGVVFINSHYSSYVLGESNQDLIKLYTILQKEGESFINYCQRYFTPEFNQKDTYYELRTTFNSLKPSKQRAALFLYLNRHGYNGLCRYNSKGIYNVPFGRYNKPYFPRQEMLYFHHKSQNAEFIRDDFRKTFDLAQPGDVIYCDPPYMPFSTKTKILPYTQKTFAEKDQIELAELARETAAKGIPVIISNHDIEFTRHHYRHAEIKSFPVSRFINCQANLRQPVRELLAIYS